MYFAYTLSILFFFNMHSTLMMWLFLELNMCIFIMMTTFLEKFSHYFQYTNKNFLYLVIQSLGSFMFLLANKMNFILEFNIFDFFMCLGLVLKMGLIPLSFWIFKYSKFLDKINFSFLITSQKLPILPLFFNFMLEPVMCVVMLNMIVGSILMLFSKTLVNILISSSIYSIIWLMLAYYSGLVNFLFLYSNYIFFILLSTLIFKVGLLFFDPKQTFSIFMIYTFLFLMGLPPFNMFFFKIFTIKISLMNLNYMNFVMIWLSSFVASLAYFFFLSKMILYLCKSYKSQENFKILLAVLSGTWGFLSLL